MTEVLCQLLETHDVQAALITHLPHVRWACGFTGSRGHLLVKLGGLHLLTDSRYVEQAEREVSGATLHVQSGTLFEIAKRQGLLEEVERVVFQPEHLSVHAFGKWRDAFPELEWVPVERMLTKAAAVKSKEAKAMMEQAQAITDQVYEEIVEYIRPGLCELEVAAEVNYRHLKHGANGMAFDTIVAAGPNSALPHARPGSRMLREGDCVILDFGCVYEGYASDMTRTVVLGKPPSTMKRVYDTVREAQQAAVECAAAGVECRKVDLAARTVIQKEGYGDNFLHSTGHGIGLEVHEWPRIARETQEKLPEGITITIEPGIYVAGQFGVRIEDVVEVEADGCRRLSKVPRELVQL